MKSADHNTVCGGDRCRAVAQAHMKASSNSFRYILFKSASTLTLGPCVGTVPGVCFDRCEEQRLEVQTEKNRLYLF